VTAAKRTVQGEAEGNHPVCTERGLPSGGRLGMPLDRSGGEAIIGKKVNAYLIFSVYGQLRKSATSQNLKPGAKPLKI